MKLKFSPQGGYPESTQIEVISENSLIIDGELFEIPEDLIELDPIGPILSGFRDVDGLHLTILFKYCDADKAIWETPPYRGPEEEEWLPS